MDAQFMAQLPQVEAMCTALYTAQVGQERDTSSCGLQMQTDRAYLGQEHASRTCELIQIVPPWHITTAVVSTGAASQQLVLEEHVVCWVEHADDNKQQQVSGTATQPLWQV